MAPLNEISGGSKASNRAIIKLTDGQIKAYHDTIALLVEAATISYEDHTKPLILFTDASDSHVGAVLEQEGGKGEMRPLAFFQRSSLRLSKYVLLFIRNFAGCTCLSSTFKVEFWGDP